MGAVVNEITIARNPMAYGHLQNSPIERRSHQRYPLQFNVRYRRLSSRHSVLGTGRTANISSTGLFVSTEDEVPVKSRLEITVEWPSLLNGEIPLQMVIAARVVRSTSFGFAVAILHHEFRTMKRHASLVAKLSQAALA